MPRLRTTAKKLLRKIGYDIVKYHPSCHAQSRKTQLLRSLNINLVFDVGANTGQFVRQLRESHYQGRIISFEPLKSAFTKLEAFIKSDPQCQALNIALGDQEKRCDMNVAENLHSSSILTVLPVHLRYAPDSIIVGREEISIKKLDSIFSNYYNAGDNVLLKIDTQGYEKKVLDGAEASLSKINTLQLELSIMPFYENELDYIAMIKLLAEKGYKLISIEPSFSDSLTGRVLQCDAMFHRD